MLRFNNDGAFLLTKMENRVLELLKTNQGYLSNQEISKMIEIGCTQVSKLIQNLIDLGYEIEIRPHLGYRLISLPDKLYSQEISWKLENKLIGKKIVYFDEVSSTMDVAHKLGIEGYAEGICVFADSQTKGRGRMGRQWFSPKGKGIYFSLLLRPSVLPNEVYKFTLLVSVCIGEAIHNITGLTYRIKWPNDILIKDKKIAGILTESYMEKGKVNFVVVGVGINVNTEISKLPLNATSIKKELVYEIKRQDLAREILKQLEVFYLMFKKGKFSAIIDIWRNHSSTLGQRVRAVFKENKNKAIEGVAIDLDKDGGLLIRDDSGFIKKIIIGEVEKIM